jgi:aminoglycoside phosphotransferase (APT) family kinase protein
MFTDIQSVKAQVESTCFRVDTLSYIPKGVMTDKYLIQSGHQYYIVRCFPKGREWLAEMEYNYLQLFQTLNIKAPKPHCYVVSPIPMLVYEYLEGTTLRDAYNNLSVTIKNKLAGDILKNYELISSVKSGGYGRSCGYDDWSDKSWNSFLQKEILQTRNIAEERNDEMTMKCCSGMLNNIPEISSGQFGLIWSDFSMDNIIVGHNGELSGFIDFEGLMSGDKRLGIGYLLAHEKSTFLDDILTCLKLGKDDPVIKFYAVFRYVRMYPYLNQNMPNGASRDSVDDYLAYSVKHIKDYSYGARV